MEKNYYDLLIKKIKELIKCKKINEAIQMIEEEFKLPYIPLEYEKKLKEIYGNINPHNINKSINKVKFSREEILVILLDEYNSHSTNFLLEIASLMEEYNWQNNLNDIEKILNNKKLDSKVKCTIYIILVLQKVNYDFKMNEIKINPIKNQTVFETKFFLKNMNLIDSNVDVEPSIREICIKILFFYTMSSFPQSLFFNEEDISHKLINISHVMLGKKSINKLTKQEREIYSHIKSSN